MKTLYVSKIRSHRLRWLSERKRGRPSRCDLWNGEKKKKNNKKTYPCSSCFTSDLRIHLRIFTLARFLSILFPVTQVRLNILYPVGCLTYRPCRTNANVREYKKGKQIYIYVWKGTGTTRSRLIGKMLQTCISFFPFVLFFSLLLPPRY